MIEVIRLPATAIARAGEILADSFFHDAIMTYMFPDETERARYSLAHFTPFVRYGHLFGEVYTTAGRTDGVAVWLPPGATEMPAAQVKAAGLDQAAARFGETAWTRFTTIMSRLEECHHRDVAPYDWYLVMLGVDRAQQGRGIGRALIRPILERADAEAAPCYLETVEPRNIPFYQRHGFPMITVDVEPHSGISFWTLRRDPQS